MTEDEGRPLPNAVDAEKELVSILFIDSSVLLFPEVDELTPEDFFHSLCREMFFAAKKEKLEGQEIAFSALINKLSSGVDWHRFFDEISTLAVHSDAGLIRKIAKTVREARQKRELYIALSLAADATRNGSGQIADILSGITGRVAQISQQSIEQKPWSQVTKSVILSGPELVPFLDQKIEYLVNPIIPKGFVTLLQGLPKGGKSTFSLFVSICLSLGRYVGPFEVIKPCKVLFLEFEDPPVLFSKRLSIYSRGLGLQTATLPENLEYCYYPEFWIDSAMHYQALQREIESRKIDLVVIDTLAHVNRAEDENSSASMRPAMMQLKRLAKESGCSVLIIHHTAKGSKDRAVAEKGRGSSIIAATADVIIDWGDRNGTDTTPVKVESKLDSSFSFSVEYQRMTDGSVEWKLETASELNMARRTQKDEVLAYLQRDHARAPNGRPLAEILGGLSNISEQIVYRHIRSLEKEGRVSISVSRGRGNPRTVRLITAGQAQ